jgi:hypothetical protein
MEINEKVYGGKNPENNPAMAIRVPHDLTSTDWN